MDTPWETLQRHLCITNNVAFWYVFPSVHAPNITNLLPTCASEHNLHAKPPLLCYRLCRTAFLLDPGLPCSLPVQSRPCPAPFLLPAQPCPPSAPLRSSVLSFSPRPLPPPALGTLGVPQTPTQLTNPLHHKCPCTHASCAQTCSLQRTRASLKALQATPAGRTIHNTHLRSRCTGMAAEVGLCLATRLIRVWTPFNTPSRPILVSPTQAFAQSPSPPP